MDDAFYHFTISHSALTDGIRHADTFALMALKARAYLNLRQEKLAGRHVNSKDIRKHRSDVLRNLIITEYKQIAAPQSVVVCIKEFVASIRNDWATLASPLAQSLESNVTIVAALLDQLDMMFISEES